MMTMSEKDVLTEHYGKPDNACKNTNLCLFVTKDGVSCTTENPRNTEDKEKTTRKPVAPPGPGNGWGEAGTTSTTGIANYWNIVELMVMIIVFV